MEPVSEDPLPPDETIATARALLAEGRPFSAHEVFEARWKDCPDVERDLWQGLAQLCVGSTHRERDNVNGARTLWSRARRRLAGYAVAKGPAYGLDLSELVVWLDARLAELPDEPPPGERAADAYDPGLPPI